MPYKSESEVQKALLDTIDLSRRKQMLRFINEQGIEVPAVNADQMREIDRIALQETGPNLFQMMENAGRNLASLAIELLGSKWQEARIIVVAGGGGNGGGGICAARHLANRNANVRDPNHLGEVPAFQLKVFRSTSGQLIPFSDVSREPVDFILDALIGYGLSAAPRGNVAALIGWANDRGAPILALDIPSGVNATNGEAPGVFIRSSSTLTLALPKTGLLPARTGSLFLADIGIPEAVYRRLGLTYTPPFADRFRIPLKVAN